MFKLQECEDGYVEHAPFTFDHTVVFPVRPGEVFDVIAGLVPNAEKEWFPHFKSAKWLTPGPPSAGSVREYRLTYMRLVEHFTIWDHGKHLTFWVSECSLPLLRRFVEDYHFAGRSDGSTEMRWRVGYDPGRWVRPLHRLLRPSFARDFDTATANLVQYFEKRR